MQTTCTTKTQHNENYCKLAPLTPPCPSHYLRTSSLNLIHCIFLFMSTFLIKCALSFIFLLSELVLGSVCLILVEVSP